MNSTFQCVAQRHYSSPLAALTVHSGLPDVGHSTCSLHHSANAQLFTVPILNLNSIISSLQQKIYSAAVGHVRLSSPVGVRHPESRLQHDGKTENLPICCTSVSPGLNPPTISESSSSSPLFPSLSAAHNADKVLDSLHFISLCKKKKKKNSNLNQCSRINAILTFGDFKASWTQTPLLLQ